MTDATLEQSLIEIARSVQAKLDTLYQHTPKPEPGSALDQAGLRDGLHIVTDFLAHDEPGLSIEHLLYMITEPDIALSRQEILRLHTLCKVLSIDVPRIAHIVEKPTHTHST